MPYKLPTLNLLCDIYTGIAFLPTVLPAGPARLTSVPCQLTYGRRVNALSDAPLIVGSQPTLQMSLLLLKLTDIRGVETILGWPDIVEVPSGSGRWYFVTGVDDIGKGFANEHRFAYICQIPAVWVPPYS